MRKILFILMLIPAAVFGQVKISNLPAATDPDADDLLILVEDGTTSKVTQEMLFDDLSDSIIAVYDSIAVHLDTAQALRVDVNSNVDSLAVHLDTVQALRTDVNTNTTNIATIMSDTTTIDAEAYILTDTIPCFLFGAGGYQAGDTAYFDYGDRSFGTYYNLNDTLVVPIFELLFLSAGDQTKINVYYGNKIANTKTDSLFTAPQPITPASTTLTPNNETKIPPASDVWIECAGSQTAGVKPVQFELMMFKQTIRD